MTKFQPVKGMRDFLPEEMIKRQFVLDIIRKVFERWGFQPLETPAVESFELLAAKGGGGEDIKREIYYFKDQGERELGLRFDLTVPLARVVVNNPNLPKPFKRYQIEKVWRYDEPQAGRYREFLSCDIDIIGSDRPEADAEIIAVVSDVFKSLGFKDFIIRLNNRKIAESFLLSLGIENYIDIFRSIDKLEKIGEEGVKKELNGKKIADNKIKEILNFIKIKGKIEILNKVEKFKVSKEGIDELKNIFEILKKLGYEKNIIIDLSLVRGLDYYTGTVFELAVSGGKWSLAGGGRFDKLIELYGGPPTPATGIGIGFDRIIEVMKIKNMFKLDKTNIKLFIAPVNDEVRIDAFKICQELRKKNISCDTDLMGRKLSKQLEYASTLGIPFVAIVGPEELKTNSVKLRNMKIGKEEIVKINKISEFLEKESNKI